MTKRFLAQHAWPVIFLTLTICSQPYQFMQDRGTVVWMKGHTLVISDCSHCGNRARGKQATRPAFKKPSLQIRIPDASAGRVMP